MHVSRASEVDCRVRAPGSKSLTNRFLLLAGLTEGASRLRRPLDSDDTRFMREALTRLGVAIAEDGEDWVVEGLSIWRSPAEPIFVGNAGTVMRFLSPALARHALEATITGNDRMQARPIGDLVDGLRQLSAQVRYLGEQGFPPLWINGPMTAGRIAIKGDASSQYLSGLLMALPFLSDGSAVEIRGPLVSRTYVEMTLDCMARFGLEATADEAFQKFEIPGGQRSKPQTVDIEPDASTASYWFALPFMTGGSATVIGVPRHSTQGDFGLLDILERMGAQVDWTEDGVTVTARALRGVEVDMNTMSDVAPTLAVIATKASSPTTIRNIGNMRIKECDRIQTIHDAFDALGLKMESGKDWMKIFPSVPGRAATLDPQEDHRMAMIFALMGLAFGGVRIKDSDCVAKTYPAFFREFETHLMTW